MKIQSMIKRNEGGESFVDFIETETTPNAPVGSYSGGLVKHSKEK